MFRKSVSIDLVEPVVCLRGQPKDKQTINILRGAIRLQISHSAIVHSITVQFTGTSKTLWPEGSLNKKTSQHWDKHILVDSVIPISKSPLLLKKGTHAFPFEILLSNALSESIECGLGHIRYKLLCQVHVKPRKLLFIKSILQSQRTVVLMRLPTLESQQQSITQTHLINDKGGQLTLNIEKGHLVPGTLLPITFNFNHLCSVHAVDQVAVKLIERQKYRAPAKQTTRILHHEIALSPNSHSSNNSKFLQTNDASKEMRIVYVVPDKHKLKVHPSTSHPTIKIKHWIQIYLRLLLKDGTIKDLQIEASITVLLSSMDDYLTLPLYNEHRSLSSDPSNTTTNAFHNTITTATVSHALSSTSISSSSITSSSVLKKPPTSWLKKIYPIKYNNDNIDTVHDKSGTTTHYHNNNNLMLLMTAPPPLYEDI